MRLVAMCSPEKTRCGKQQYQTFHDFHDDLNVNHLRKETKRTFQQARDTVYLLSRRTKSRDKRTRSHARAFSQRESPHCDTVTELRTGDNDYKETTVIKGHEKDPTTGTAKRLATFERIHPHARRIIALVRCCHSPGKYCNFRTGMHGEICVFMVPSGGCARGHARKRRPSRGRDCSNKSMFITGTNPKRGTGQEAEMAQARNCVLGLLQINFF